MADKSVVVRLRAVVSEYNAAMGKAAVATDGVTKKSGDFTKLGVATSQLGGQLTRNVTLPLLAVGAAAGKMSYDFEATFAKMQGLAGVAAGEVDGLKDSVLGLAGETGRGPQELAEGLYFVRSAGIEGAAAMETLETSAKAATAGLGSTAAVADAVTSALNAYGEGALSAAEAGDILAATAREGKAEASELAPQFGRLLPIAAELGVEFHEVGAGMAFLSRSSGDAALSATQLNGVLVKLLEPGVEGAAALEAIGSSAEKLRESVRERGLLPTLVTLREELEANGLSLNDFSRDQQFLQGALQLTGVQAEQAAEVFASLEGSTGSLGDAFDAVAATDGYKMKQAMVDVQVALVQLGDVVLPVAAAVASFGSTALSAFTKLPGPMAQLILGFIAVSAAAGPVLKMASPLITAYKKLADVVGVVAPNSFAKLGVAMTGFGFAGAVVGIGLLGRELVETKLDVDRLATSLADMSEAELHAEGIRLLAINSIGKLDDVISDAADSNVVGAQRILDTAAAAGLAADEVARLQAVIDDKAAADVQGTQDQEAYTAATDAATAGLTDEEVALQGVVDAINAQADALRALFDPLFGAQDAASKLADAQAAVMDAAIKNSDALDDNNVSAAEMVRLNGEATRAALDYQGSLLTLKAAVEDGSVSVEDSIATLQAWVDEGLITQQQANEAAYAISVMGDKADAVNGKSVVVHASLDAAAMFRDLDALSRKLNAIPGHVRVSVGGGGGVQLGAEDGGLITHSRRSKPGPTDTIPMMAAPGEFMFSAAAVRRLGVPTLEAMNRGGQSKGAGVRGNVVPLFAGGGQSMTVVNHVYEIHAQSIDERQVGRYVRDVIEASGRRGTRVKVA